MLLSKKYNILYPFFQSIFIYEILLKFYIHKYKIVLYVR